MELFVKVVKKWMEMGWPLPLIFYKLAGYQHIRQWRYDEATVFFLYLQKKYPNRIEGYEGLIILARKTHQAELLLRRLSDALEQFPQNLDFTRMYIKNLLVKGDFDQARQLINKNTLRFQNNPAWVVVEATFWREQYDYQKAQNILNVAVEKHPEHQTLQLMQADNLWRRGDSQQAKNILENLRPKLDYKNNFLPINFTIPYIEILLDNNDTAGLRSFFEKAVAAKIQNWEIISGYNQLLISLEDYGTATSIIKKMIEREGTRLYFNYFALLFFDLEKIKNIQSFDESEQLLLSGDSDLDALPAFYPKLISHLERHPKFKKEDNIVMDIFRQMSRFSKRQPVWLNTYSSLKENYHVAQIIIKNIKMKQPFSLIRLGDGEGHFLPYETNLQSFQHEDRVSSQRIWWGCEKIDEKTWEQLEGGYFAAIQNADLLGIPGPWRCCKTILNVSSGNSKLNTEARGLKSIFNFLDTYAPDQKDNQILTSCHIHTHLEDLGLWDLILQEVDSCSVVSCHSALEKVLLDKHGIKVDSFYDIPSEFKYSRLFQEEQEEMTPHFPERFEDIRAKISVTYPGEVFLVAAGFLGKFYCQIIKEKGGIALDIGSAADYWLDYQTRFWTRYPSPINFSKSGF